MNKTLKLVEPDMSYKEEILRYIQEFLSSKEDLHGIARLLKDNSYEVWLIKIRDRALGINLPINKVRTTTYLAIYNNEIVGDMVFRHELNDELLNYNGHIGYTVRPGKRNKGYATMMLKEVMMIAKSEGLSKLLVTCDSGNLASEKVIVKNGGIFEDTRVELDGNAIKRFWIDL